MSYSINIQDIVEIAREAGKEILEVYARDFEVMEKQDESPLTEADQKSNDVILKGLQDRYPEIPFISEESKETAYSDRKDWDHFWLIDPLDGTKEFIKKNGEFTVNIALVKQGEPVLGVVYIPVQDKVFYAEKGNGAFSRVGENTPEKLHNPYHYSDKESVVVVASRSHLSQEVLDFVEQLKEKGKHVDFLSAGSSLKFCLVAEGKADVYPRLGPTMEWDTGAAHAVVLEAGKQVNRHDTGEPLKYNKENLLNPWFIVE
jgi:3'(2'), 5'-bisphosphate nucleotidase